MEEQDWGAYPFPHHRLRFPLKLIAIERTFYYCTTLHSDQGTQCNEAAGPRRPCNLAHSLPVKCLIRKSLHENRDLNLDTEPPANILIPRSRKRGLLLNCTRLGQRSSKCFLNSTSALHFPLQESRTLKGWLKSND